MKILAIDDNRDNLTTIKAVLKEALPECTVLTALNGPDGIKLARTEDPDAILLDIIMPGMDGLEVCRRLKADEHLRDIPLVFLTAIRSDQESRIKALEAGAEAFLSKPPDEQELIALIRVMTKVKASTQTRRLENERLAELVTVRTRELEKELAGRLQVEGELRRSLDRAEHSRQAMLSTLEDQKRMEFELRGLIADAQRFRDALDQVSSCIYMKDIQSRYVFANRATLQLFGCSAEELVGSDDTFFFPPETVQRQREVDLRVFKGEQTDEEIDIVDAAGGKRIYLEIKTPIYLEPKGQTIWGLLGISTDITERCHAEDALLESEKQSKAIFEGASIGIAQADPNTGYWLCVNQKMCEITGYSSDELLEMRIPEITHPEDREQDWVAFQNVVSGKLQNYRLEKRYICKDHTTVWVNVNMTVIRNFTGQPVRTIATIEDITERKKAEEEKAILEVQFQQAQKLEAVGRLTGGIAHDFNNLLTVIIGNTELALREVGEDSPLHEFLEDIKGAGERSSVLIRQLLAFSRKQILQPEVVNLNETVGNVNRMLQRIIGEDVKLKTILSPDLGLVEADVGQVEQILMNLAVNARDAMHTGGKLTLETSNVELDETYARKHIGVIPGPYVMLAVSDTGVGMTQEVQANIFEPFFTTKENGKGTGLGLSTVYGIVNQSKGSIWVYSEPGKGSAFKIYLPRVKETVRIVEEAANTRESLQGSETILLVEDEEQVRNIAFKALQNCGYTVLCARNGLDAFHISQQHKEPVQLMLTDVVMPGMSGRELAKRMEEPRPEMKVLFMSGYTDNAIVHNGLLDKGIAFIQKPFTPVELARKVREVLNK